MPNISNKTNIKMNQSSTDKIINKPNKNNPKLSSS
jgi:hypothetical protein